MGIADGSEKNDFSKFLINRGLPVIDYSHCDGENSAGCCCIHKNASLMRKCESLPAIVREDGPDAVDLLDNPREVDKKCPKCKKIPKLCLLLFSDIFCFHTGSGPKSRPPNVEDPVESAIDDGIELNTVQSTERMRIRETEIFARAHRNIVTDNSDDMDETLLLDPDQNVKDLVDDFMDAFSPKPPQMDTGPIHGPFERDEDYDDEWNVSKLVALKNGKPFEPQWTTIKTGKPVENESNVNPLIAFKNGEPFVMQWEPIKPGKFVEKDGTLVWETPGVQQVQPLQRQMKLVQRTQPNDNVDDDFNVHKVPKIKMVPPSIQRKKNIFHRLTNLDVPHDWDKDNEEFHLAEDSSDSSEQKFAEDLKSLTYFEDMPQASLEESETEEPPIMMKPKKKQVRLMDETEVTLDIPTLNIPRKYSYVYDEFMH